MLPSILLIRSADPRWADLRAALDTQPHLRLLADVRRVAHAVPAAAEHRPTVILLDAGLGERPAAALAAEMRAASPVSTIAVVGEAAQLDEETLVALCRCGVFSYLTWEDLRPATLRRALAVLLDERLFVASRPPFLTLLAALERRRAARVEGLVLTPQERSVSADETGRPAPPALRVALLARSGVLAATLRAICDLLDLPLTVVETADALLAAEGAALFVDASAEDITALEACVEVVARASRPVHIVHPSPTVVDELKAVARVELTWLPPDVGVMTLFRTLARLKLQASLPAAPAGHALLTEAMRPPHFTSRERQVSDLIEAGCDIHEIAARLDMSESTAKTHVLHVRLKQRLAPPGLP